jgi:2,3-dihydroxybiphenyl 1,2-dioxygenase
VTPRVGALSYVRVMSADVESWARFLSGILGMEVARHGSRAGVVARMDALPPRVVVQDAELAGAVTLGWEASASSLDELVEAVAELGYAVTPLSVHECQTRSVVEGVTFTDADGFVHECVLGFGPPGTPAELAGVTAFVTGDMGMGHVVLRVNDLAVADRLYGEALAMVLREDIPTQTGQRGHFFGCNPRHHSIAALEAHDGPPLRHFMVEMATLDDVGCALDRALAGGWPVTKTIGRHRTDNMVSFYVATPTGFEVEVGYGGLLVDDREWDTVKESTRRRPWGHRSPASPASA